MCVGAPDEGEVVQLSAIAQGLSLAYGAEFIFKMFGSCV